MIYAATRKQIQEICDSNIFYIYGAGNNLGLFLDSIKLDKAKNNIKGIIDGNVSKQGNKVDIYDVKIEIISIESVIPDVKYFFVTNYEFVEIAKMLDAKFFNSKVIVCRMEELAEQNKRMDQAKRPQNIRIYEEELIPKTIHYCWFGPNKIPDNCLEYMKSWEKYCPDYKIIKWSEENYDVTGIPFIKDAYEAKKYAFVSDYARLDIIYKYGGIYLDTDVELIKPLDDLLYQKAYAGIEGDEYVNLGLGFGAVKGLDIIKKLRDDYLSLLFDINNTSNFTCPKVQTTTLKKMGYIPNGDYQIVNDLSIFPQAYFSGTDYKFYKENIKDECFSIHHYEASWRSEVDKKKNEAMKELAKRISFY